jgi:agmatinase
MIQIGLRGAGSARQAEVDAARQYGSVLVKAEELHKVGVEAVLQRVPAADCYYVTVDIDGLDPAIAPGTGFPPFGGLTYYQATDLLRGIAAKGKVVGFDLVEVAPGLDTGNITSFLAAQLILNMIGALAHEGQIGLKAEA